MADDKDIAEETQQGGGGKKPVLIVVAAAVLLLATAAVAFFVVGGDAADEDGEDAVAETAVDDADPVYHKLAPEFVVSLPPGGEAGMLQIAIEVMTQHPGVVETLEANDPMIRHHLLNLLESQSAADLMTTQGKLALQAAISDLLAEKLEELGEPGTVRGVFFTQFVLQ